MFTVRFATLQCLEKRDSTCFREMMMTPMIERIRHHMESKSKTSRHPRNLKLIQIVWNSSGNMSTKWCFNMVEGKKNVNTSKHIVNKYEMFACLQ